MTAAWNSAAQRSGEASAAPDRRLPPLIGGISATAAWSHIDRGRALGLLGIGLSLAAMPQQPAWGGAMMAGLATLGLVVIGLKAIVRSWTLQLGLDRLMWPILIAGAGAACLLRQPDHVLLIATALAVYAATTPIALLTAGLLVWAATLPVFMVWMGGPPVAAVDTLPKLVVLALGIVIGRTLGGDPLAAVLPQAERSLGDDSDFENRAPERVLQRLQELLSGDSVQLVSGGGDEVRVSRLLGGALTMVEDDPSAGLRLLAARLRLMPGEARLIDFDRGRLLARGRFGLREELLVESGAGAGYLLGMPLGDGVAAVFVARARPSLVGLLSAEAAAQVLVTIGDRMSAMRHWRKRVLREARQQMGRDIHDSILQSLAGIRMQLAALRAAQRSGDTSQIAAIASDIDEILEGEQVALRAMISDAGVNRDDHDLYGFLRRRLEALGRQWRISIAADLPDRPLPVTEETALECEFLLREVFSNAVRHAQATRIHVSFGTTDELLIVTVKTNGRRLSAGPAAETGPGIQIESLSLGARLRRLGASAYSEPVASGTLMSIRLPMEKS
jgi:signal transduction histidine kinase